MNQCVNNHDNSTSSPQIIKFSDDINASNITLSMLAERIDYTCLESTEESYIGRISILKSNDRYILIYDNLLNRILLFTIEGKFISQIGSEGKGPGEYSFVSSLDISNENDIIIVHDMVGKLIFYSTNNNLERELKTDLKIKDFSIVGDKLFVIALYPNTINYDGFSCFIIDINNGKIIQQLLRRSDSKPSKRPIIACFNEYYSFSDSTFFWEYRYDTIYGISKDFNINARWVVDLGLRRVANDAFSSTTNLYNSTLDNGLVLTSFVETGKYFFWEVIDNSERKRFVTDKSSNKTFLLKYDNKDYLIPNDLDNGPGFWPHTVFNSSMVIGIINSSSLLTATADSTVIMNQVLDSISRVIDEFDNPILMKITLKDS